MKRYNVTVTILANVAIIAKSPDNLEKQVTEILEVTNTIMLNDREFVVEGGEVTGVYNVNWLPVEIHPDDTE